MLGERPPAGRRAGPADDWTGLQPGVISRMRAEAHESWTARARRAVRRHAPGLDWPRVDGRDVRLRGRRAEHAALRVAGAGRLAAAYFAVMAAPAGSDLNPARLDARFQVPSVPRERHRVRGAGKPRGRRKTTSWCRSPPSSRAKGACRASSCSTNDHTAQDVRGLVDALSRGRLEPAQLDGTGRGQPGLARRPHDRQGREEPIVAVATLFIASVTRMITLRAASSPRASPRTPRAASPGCRPSDTPRATGSRRASTPRAEPATVRPRPRT